MSVVRLGGVSRVEDVDLKLAMSNSEAQTSTKGSGLVAGATLWGIVVDQRRFLIGFGRKGVRVLACLRYEEVCEVLHCLQEQDGFCCKLLIQVPSLLFDCPSPQASMA